MPIEISIKQQPTNGLIAPDNIMKTQIEVLGCVFEIYIIDRKQFRQFRQFRRIGYSFGVNVQLSWFVVVVVEIMKCKYYL